MYRHWYFSLNYDNWDNKGMLWNPISTRWYCSLDYDIWDKKGHNLKSHIYKVILQSESWHLGLKRANFEISYLQGDIAHCWLEDVQNYKNKSPQNNYIFLIPLNIPDYAASIVFLIRVRLPGGAAIIFAQSWNFELKFLWIIHLCKKSLLQV